MEYEGDANGAYQDSGRDRGSRGGRGSNNRYDNDQVDLGDINL